MNKSTGYLGQPLFGQLLSLLDRGVIAKTIKTHKANRCYKKFFLWDHLVTMLYAVYSNCTGLREVQCGLELCKGKLNHLNIDKVVPRSTFSDGNKLRPSRVFGSIYELVYAQYKHAISDSTLKPAIAKKLYILDSSTISLFKAILKPAGRKRADGKSKGGMKVNALLQADTCMPSFVTYMAAAMHDQQFYKSIQHLPDHSIIVFDKAYINYEQFAAFGNRDISYVTRQKDNALYASLEEFNLPDEAQHILKDERIEVKFTKDNEQQTLQMRRVVMHTEKRQEPLVFITNNFALSATEIASIYQNRWQIEVFFKKLKQNFPLSYFFGDNANAIEIQIWCALIALLLLQVLHKEQKSSLAFSTLASIVRLHLMNYISIPDFIEEYKKKRPRPKARLPDKDKQNAKAKRLQQKENAAKNLAAVVEFPVWTADPAEQKTADPAFKSDSINHTKNDLPVQERHAIDKPAKTIERQTIEMAEVKQQKAESKNNSPIKCRPPAIQTKLPM